MIEITENPKIVERAFLLGTRDQRVSLREAEDHLDELAQLVDTMGVPVVGRMIAPLREPNPALMVGSGKAEEIIDECRRLEADCLIFDDDLSPAQQRNWEKLADICVIDRQEVILDIFARRASTREARLQVRLARLEYSLPRLRRAWTHLERQRGGGGFRGGAGELQLELDQRIVRDQIAAVKRDLAEVRKRRAVQRQQRLVKPVPTAAIVGYTNAGKSTLLRALTDADVLVEDKLFATLDPTTRRVVLPNNQELLITDTVGFIRKLPHDLIESFKATLEETRLADYLVHVVDVSHPNAPEHIEATRAVLEELDAADKPILLALNKIDRVDDPALTAARYANEAETVIPISAQTGEGIERFLDALAALRGRDMDPIILEIPMSRYDVVSQAHEEGNVLVEGYRDGAAWIKVDMPENLQGRFAEFIRDEMPERLDSERDLTS